MKSLILWILFLAFFAITISIILFPTRKDLALIDLKSAKFHEAAAYFQGEYDHGKRTPEIIIGLAKLNQKQGKLDAAILLIQDYLKQHPEDPSALRLLTDLYLENQQDTEYFQTLLKLDQKRSDKETLQELVEWYTTHGYYEDLFSALKRLVATGKADESDYLELAYLYAEKKEYPDALNLLEVHRQKFPHDDTMSNILFEVWVFSQMAQKAEDKKKFNEQSVSLVSDFLLKKNDPISVNYALSTFRNKYPALLPLLLEKLDPIIKKNSSLEKLVLQLDMDIPSRKEKAMERINELVKDPNAPVELQNLAFDKYLEKEDRRHFVDLVNTIPLKNIQERSLINAILLAIKNNDKELAEKIKESLGHEYLAKHQAVAISLAFALHEKDVNDHFKRILSSKTLSNTERYYLFKLAFALNDEAEILEIGKELFPYVGMDDQDLIDLALAFVQIKKSEVLYQLITEAAPKIGKKKAETVQAILNISSGRPKEAAEWLFHEKDLTDPMYSALMTVAEQSKEYPLALYIAKRRLKDFPSPVAKADYALALVQVGKIQEGMNSLKKIYEENKNSVEIERDYFYALVYSVSKRQGNEDLLLSFMEEKEKKGNLSKEWLEIFAYVYLENLNRYRDAERLFAKLALMPGAKSSYSETLVYLWGPRSTPERIQWLEEQAAKSSDENLHKWIENLNYIQAYRVATAIFEERSACAEMGPRAYFAYMYALANLEENDLLKRVIASSLPLFKTRKELEELSILAEGAFYYAGQRAVWETLALMYPEDPLVWQNLAKAAFNQHDYTAAEKALLQLFSFYCYDAAWEWEVEENLYCSWEGEWQPAKKLSSDGKLYESLYEYGEIAKKRRCYTKAEAFFRLAIAKIEEAEEQTVDMLKLKALMIYEMSKFKVFTWSDSEVIGLMEQAYELSSRDADVKADYANILMDMGYLKSTRALLENEIGQ